MHHKEKFEMAELILKLYLFFRSELLRIIEMHINNTLILINNNFASIKEEAIISSIIVIKN